MTEQELFTTIMLLTNISEIILITITMLLIMKKY